MRRVSTLAAALPLLLASSAAAFAHAHLKTAEPAVESTVATAPAAVTIAFTEGVEPKFSSIVVTDAAGRRVDKNDPSTAPGDAKRLTVGLGPLTPGVYTVTWHATAVDTHKTEGSFHFTLGAGSAQTGGGITIDHAWSRATPPNGKTGAAYVTLTARDAADQLIGASTPVAGLAELHQTTNDQGVMKMRPVPMLALEAGTPVTLGPGGYHIMMMDLKQPLKQGDHFPLTLSFAHAGTLTVDVTVEGIGAAAPMNHDAPGAGAAPK